MTNRVYLLGAGFSRAISESAFAQTQHLGQREPMPLLADLSAAVRNRMGGTLGDIPGGNTPLANDFERLMSYLAEEPPWLDEIDRLQNRAAFIRVSRTVHQALTDLQHRTVEQTLCPPWLANLVRHWEETRATVITLNYDTLVELAWSLHARPAENISTDLHWMPIVPMRARMGYSMGEIAAPNRPWTGMKLLKLHGSLNWYYSGPGGLASDMIYDVGINAQDWSSRGMQPLEKNRHAINTIDLVPMIVPPAAVKSAYYGNKILQMQWNVAGNQLSDASGLIIMGFSLPVTDMTVGSLLCTRLRQSAEITPVDYGDAVVENICEIFGIASTDPRINRDYVNGGSDAIPKWVDANVK